MRKGRGNDVARTIVAFCVVAGALAGTPLAAQSYDPVGPQTVVDKSVVTEGGWSLCFESPYAIWTGPWMPTLETLCTGEKLMLACGTSWSETLSLLGAAQREEVLEDCGDGGGDSHLANGTQWYHAHGGSGLGRDSWGFAAEGETVTRNNCDAGTSDPGHRLCWHLQELGGYRCGTAVNLNGTPEWTKYVYRWTSAVFADGFEGDVCGWSQASGATDDCTESLTLALEPSCGSTVIDQGPLDLDPEPLRIGYRFAWQDLRREWGYRLQTDYATTFEAEEEYVELPADTSQTPIRICQFPIDCSWSYRLIAHVGHWGGHVEDFLPGDVVSNECTVVTSWPPD